MNTKQNFIAAARMLVETKASGETIHAFADFFENDNPRFDRQKFLEAAGYALLKMVEGLED